MSTHMKARLGALAATLAVVTTTVIGGAGTAAAADSFSFGYSTNTSGDAVIGVRNNSWGEAAGNAMWQKDPSGSEPGDALSAYDVLADGYGIEAHLSTGRVATTRGHASPYSVTVTGNLPEDTGYTMWVCVVKGDFSKCSEKYAVRA
ncbi:hypothetical protein [Streptomyces sp. SP18BB07]|uniref:hypothetical protein n=1 Tax=Streptomyces sp. SP18BB07 TaxID=3002522 RepID=UPI002E76D5E1|nr:hypothetical protein [Streptomyces sp. SP18BB07]MEE1761533.1 hypothetical protein [Streptomyces sp. SP18BB07]